MASLGSWREEILFLRASLRDATRPARWVWMPPMRAPVFALLLLLVIPTVQAGIKEKALPAGWEGPTHLAARAPLGGDVHLMSTWFPEIGSSGDSNG